MEVVHRYTERLGLEGQADGAFRAEVAAGLRDSIKEAVLKLNDAYVTEG